MTSSYDMTDSTYIVFYDQHPDGKPGGFTVVQSWRFSRQVRAEKISAGYLIVNTRFARQLNSDDGNRFSGLERRLRARLPELAADLDHFRRLKRLSDDARRADQAERRDRRLRTKFKLEELTKRLTRAKI